MVNDVSADGRFCLFHVPNNEYLSSDPKELAGVIIWKKEFPAYSPIPKNIPVVQ
jgi:hypothetical protein